MRKVLILSLLSLTMLCACNKSGGANNKPVTLRELSFNRRERVIKESGKTLELKAISGVTFTDKESYHYMDVDGTAAEFKLNYKVSDLLTFRLECDLPFEDWHLTALYLEFYESNENLLPSYQCGGTPVCEQGQSRIAIIDNISLSKHIQTDAYMHVRLTGTSTYTLPVLTVKFGYITVTSK